MERREHARFGVHASVDFEWKNDGVLCRGQGLTRDINSKGMFIFSDCEPPAKADLKVEVFFHSVAGSATDLRMKANGLVIRVERAQSAGCCQGFALLHRSYRLDNGSSFEH